MRRASPVPAAGGPDRALDGVKILDFTQLIAGPFATCQLALLGADVIKVERPGMGDQFAHALQTDAARPSGRAFPFQSANHNKRSLSIDLRKPGARDVILRIARSADVVVENFAAGTIARLGLGYEDVKAVKPDIVYCSVSGYGQRGPKAGRPAYDAAIQAASGMMSVNGDEASGPLRTGYLAVDVPTAMMAAFAITAGLFRKLRTGQGQYLDVAMMDTAVLMQMPSFVNYMNGGVVPGLFGNRSIAANPTSDAFQARGGSVLITTLHEAHVAAMFRALGLADAYADPRFATDAARKANADALRPLLAEAFATDTAAHWAEVLGAAGIGIAAVATIPEVASDPQFEHRGLFADVAMAGMPERTIRTTVTSFTSSTEVPEVRPAPTLGQHTDEILREYGYGETEIADLRERQIV